MVNLPTVQSFKYIGSTIDRRGGASKDVENIVAKAWLVEMERTEWSDLRQESPNEIEDPDIPDSDSTDTAVRLRNMANVSQR